LKQCVSLNKIDLKESRDGLILWVNIECIAHHTERTSVSVVFSIFVVSEHLNLNCMVIRFTI